MNPLKMNKEIINIIKSINILTSERIKKCPYGLFVQDASMDSFNLYENQNNDNFFYPFIHIN